ncbi:MAG TPA: hypothetical protein VIV60_09065, partial [Polyangiaceae bacterium]
MHLRHHSFGISVLVASASYALLGCHSGDSDHVSGSDGGGTGTTSTAYAAGGIKNSGQGGAATTAVGGSAASSITRGGTGTTIGAGSS